MVFNPILFVKEAKAEFAKVIWPTRNQTLRLTMVVIFVSVLVGAYIFTLDSLLAKIVEKFLR